MRTIGHLVGHKFPNTTAEDSFDVLPALLGKKSAKPIRDHLIHHSGGGLFAIRQGHWKLILGKGSGGFTRYKPPKDAPDGQLYNLADDPGEKQNLYRKQPKTVKRLSALLDRYKKQGHTFSRTHSSNRQE